MNFTEVFSAVIGLIAVLAFVGGLAYFTTRVIGQASGSRFKNSNMKIIEVLNLGFQKYLYLVEIAGEYVVLGVSKENMTMIDKVEPSNIKIVDNQQNIDFKSVLKTFIKKEK